MPAERLQKIIAAAGIASRRKAEELITGGVVSVNGQVVTELGTKADPERDHIRVHGKLLHGPERHTYLLMNKPKGYVTTLKDPEHRPTVMDLLHGVGARVYPVGRLDYASEGLLLLTNDGEFANRLMKAASHVLKTYIVKVAGTPDPEGLARLPYGKSVGAVAGMAKRYGIPVLALAGGLGDNYQSVYNLGIDAIEVLPSSPMTLAYAMEHAAELVSNATERALRMIRIGTSMKSS